MISNTDFNHFLKRGFIEGLPPGAPMQILLEKFGEDYWYVKEVELNGLIYGIIKIGFIEFHIYNEIISGISYRPDIRFQKKDFKDVEIPWIFKNSKISKVESNLSASQIIFKKYTITGPQKTYETAGAIVGLGEGEHTFIDTEGGVTFIFESNFDKHQHEAYQICKYYDLQ